MINIFYSGRGLRTHSSPSVHRHILLYGHVSVPMFGKACCMNNQVSRNTFTTLVIIYNCRWLHIIIIIIIIIIRRVIKSRRMRWAGMWHVWGKGEVCTRFWWGNLSERDQWGDQEVDGRIILRWIFREWEGVVGTGWSWLRIGTGGERL